MFILHCDCDVRSQYDESISVALTHFMSWILSRRNWRQCSRQSSSRHCRSEPRHSIQESLNLIWPQSLTPAAWKTVASAIFTGRADIFVTLNKSFHLVNSSGPHNSVMHWTYVTMLCIGLVLEVDCVKISGDPILNIFIRFPNHCPPPGSLSLPQVCSFNKIYGKTVVLYTLLLLLNFYVKSPYKPL